MSVPGEVDRVDDRHVPVPEGDDIPVRVYTPADAVAGEAGVLVWFHGGDWVIGDIATADATCRALANRSGAAVVSVDYRLAPEHQAPAALDDCLAALRWPVETAQLPGIDATKAAVGGAPARGTPAAPVRPRTPAAFRPTPDTR